MARPSTAIGIAAPWARRVALWVVACVALSAPAIGQEAARLAPEAPASLAPLEVARAVGGAEAFASEAVEAAPKAPPGARTRRGGAALGDDGLLAPPPLFGDAYEEGVNLLWYAVKAGIMLVVLALLGYLTVRLVGPRVGPLGGSPEDLIQVRALKRLDPKTQLYLVEVAGQFVLISVSDRIVQPLSKADLDAEAIARHLDASLPQARGARTFASLLAAGRPKASALPVAEAPNRSVTPTVERGEGA